MRIGTMLDDDFVDDMLTLFHSFNLSPTLVSVVRLSGRIIDDFLTV